MEATEKESAVKATKKKTTRRSRKPAQGEATENVKPIGPQYQMSAEEISQWKTIRAKQQLAVEKRERAAAEEELALMLQKSWLDGIMTRLSIKKGTQFSVNGDTGIVQVMKPANDKGKS